MSDSTRDALMFVVQKSVAALRRDVENVDRLPAEVIVPSIVDEADALSSALVRLGRYVADDPPAGSAAEPEEPRIDVSAVLDMLTRARTGMVNGLCEECGGILPPAIEPGAPMPPFSE